MIEACPHIEPSVLSLDEFLRDMHIYRDLPHMVFLGAGASVSSGIPTAADCVEDWKRQIYLSQHTKHPWVSSAGPEEISNWLKSNPDFSVDDCEGEYSFFARKCYGDSGSRKMYFDERCAGKIPSVGYQLIALLAKADIVKAVWTTNFDGLAIKAAGLQALDVTEAGPNETAIRAGPPFRNRRLLHVALHGDYRYDLLKNLDEKTREQDLFLREVLKRRIVDYALIVVGYSGRDHSVMATLKEAYEVRNWGRLYWCGRDLLPTGCVAELICSANRNGNRAFYVPRVDFDDLFGQLALHCLDGELRDKAQALLGPARKPLRVIDRISGQAYASMNQASMLVAKAARSHKRLPDDILPQLSGLPSLRVDTASFSLDGYDVIFRAWLKQGDGREKELWARVGTIEHPTGVVPTGLEAKLLKAADDLKTAADGGGGRGDGKKGGDIGKDEPPGDRPKDSERAENEGPGDARKGDLVISRTGRDTLAVFGSSKEEVRRAGRISI